MKKAKGRGKPAAFDLTGALGEAGWAEADRALVVALAEFSAIEAALASLTKTKSAKASRDAADALSLLGQALAATARKRGVERFGVVGASEAYDPARHTLDQPSSRTPAKVKILAPGFVRGREVLTKARVAGVRVRKPTR